MFCLYFFIYNRYNNIYFSKQRKFKCLVKRVQKAIITKEYKKQGYSLNNYVKKNWNISQYVVKKSFFFFFFFLIKYNYFLLL